MGNSCGKKVETPRYSDIYVKFAFTPSVDTPVLQDDTPAVVGEPVADSEKTFEFVYINNGASKNDDLNKAMPKILSNDTIYKDGAAGTPEIGGDFVTTPSISSAAYFGGAEEEVAAADVKMSDLKAGVRIDWAASGLNGPRFDGDPNVVEAAVDRFWIDAKEVNLGNVIGKGNFGNVHGAMYQFSKVAVKTVDPGVYMKEGGLFFELTDHPNICRFYGVYHQDNQYFMVMEFMKDGSLLAYLHNNDVGADQLWTVCGQITAAVHHCYKKGVIHADIALRNCLVDSRAQRVCLTDFGLARKSSATEPLLTMAPRWASPELARSRIPTFASDVWAVGITFVELMTGGEKPYPVLTSERVVKLLMDEPLYHPPIDDAWPVEMKQMLVEIFVAEEDRPTIKAIATTCMELRFANEDE